MAARSDEGKPSIHSSIISDITLAPAALSLCYSSFAAVVRQAPVPAPHAKH